MANVTTTVASPKRSAYTIGFGGGFAYQAAGHTQELAGFVPSLRSADAEVRQGRDRIVARSRDIDRNNGLINGGIDRRVDAVVGANIWLKCKPNFAAMGMSAEWADEWAIRTEALFSTWANSSRFLCDAERHHQFGGMVRLAYRHFVTEGEACAAVKWLDRGGMFATAIQIVDPDRISNPDARPDSRDLIGGVELDRNGAEKAYHVRVGHPGDGGVDAMRWERVARETNTGRPLFVRAIDKRRAHQHRAIGRLAAVMARVQQQSLADKTELQAQITNAVFGLYATSQRGSADMAASMGPPSGAEDVASVDADRVAFYEEGGLTFDGVRVAVVPDGDKIETLTAERASTNFVAFQSYIIRSIASALGLSYEQLSNDWSGINYSSARTLLNEIWRGLIADRHLFTQAFCTPIFAAWLEEAVARDLIEVPGGKAMFYVFRDALTQCQWIGPGRGIIDRKKEAEGAQMDRAGGVSTLELDCAEQGRDWREVMWQRKREREAAIAYGLDPDEPAGGDAGGGDDEDDPDAGDAAESREARGRTGVAA